MGTAEGNNSVRVSWANLTLGKDEGGLGMRDISAWNRASSLKLIWLLFFQPNSIWATCFRHQVLEDELSKFWIINQNSLGSLINSLSKENLSMVGFGKKNNQFFQLSPLAHVPHSLTLPTRPSLSYTT
ncbi:hypothetical protein V5N11_013061 [Cardamine amara subsp. amara]|uniref:Uncharacterized protein n=1 Tax=Cardamine amara subsp. amara TaxID=228776 RepID=A0ABD1A7I6_CARAN